MDKYENTKSNMIEEQADSFDDEMYDFVFHFMPWFVYNLKPERKFLLDDENYIGLNCPCDIELHKMEIGDKTCRIVSFDETSFADIDVPMCMIVTGNNGDELLGYFTVEKDDFMGFVLCKADTEEHSLLGSISWQEMPSKEQFATDVISKYVEKRQSNEGV
jgi:hypothetical protein